MNCLSIEKNSVDEVNPVLRFNAGQTWICFDDDCFASPTINEEGELVAKRLTIREHGSAAECPICFWFEAPQVSISLLLWRRLPKKALEKVSQKGLR